MKWYKKILFWELHRIPLSVILCSMILLGTHVFELVLFKGEQEGSEMMFYTHLIFFVLIVFNFIFTFTWIISLFFRIENASNLILPLLIIYYVCLLFFFLMPVLYLI